MASMSMVSTWPSASLSLLTGSTRRSTSFLSLSTTTSGPTRSGLLHCSFIPSSSYSLSFPSSFSGLSLGLVLNSNVGERRDKGRGLVVRAGKAALCLTKAASAGK